MTVAGDDTVGVVAGEEVVIYGIGHLRPHRRAVGAVVELRQRIVVPQDAIVVGGDEEGCDGHGVLLEEGAVVAPPVHDAVLVLAQAVEGFLRREEELLTDAVDGIFLSGDLHRREGGLSRTQDRVVLSVGEGDGTRTLVEGDGETGGGDHQRGVILPLFPLCPHHRIAVDHQAGVFPPLPAGKNRHADDVVADDLQPEEPLRRGDAHFLITAAGGEQHRQKQEDIEDAFSHGRII